MKKKEIILILSVSFLIIITVFFILLFTIGACNDGTKNNKCSSIKPYFCSGRILAEKASVCGCENTSVIEGEKCVSEFQSEPKNITLEYVLRGSKGEIDFVVYKKMADYLSKLPRYINSYENPTLLDFRLRTLDEKQQRELLLPLVVLIEKETGSKEDQARIAISLVQNIPFGNSNKTLQFGNEKIEYQRYPYEVLYDMEGVCSEKSELLIFLLREIGYESSFLYYPAENHEAVGIKCPIKESFNNTEYCFIETTGPSIITDDKTEYLGGAQELNSTPIILNIPAGMSFGRAYEYRDANTLMSIRDTMKKYGKIGPFQFVQFKIIKARYGLIDPNEYVF